MTALGRGARLVEHGGPHLDSGLPVHFVGPWDLDCRLASIPSDPAAGPVVFIESRAKRLALPWHRQKLVLILSAQRHFMAELIARGHDVSRVQAVDYATGLRAFCAHRGSRTVVAMRPRDLGPERALTALATERDGLLDVVLHDDGGPGGHFLLTRDEARAWAARMKPPYRMDVFYRWMRKRTGLLMDDSGRKPLGGKWSFDKDNRKKVPKNTPVPQPLAHPPDALTREVMAQVAGYDGLWGQLEPFDWPVDRAGALRELDDFIDRRLVHYGDYQDALVTGEPFLWHARISAAMNLSLLHPREVVDRVVAALGEGAPMNAVEGFVRQVIGWREFIRVMYLVRMPEMRHANALDAHRPLPDFFWDPAATSMRCVQQAVSSVHRTGYAHHIQRLMVLGNLALLAGLRPLDVSHWFWAAFVDAAEWVELPNVHGMALYADPGFTTKPYSASGAYIHRQGDHCKSCPHDVRKRTGPAACPFNALYWDFTARHRALYESNPRLARLLHTWNRWDDAERDAIRAQAARWLSTLTPADPGWSPDDDAC